MSEIKLFEEEEEEEEQEELEAVVPVTDALDELQVGLLTIDTLLTLALECTNDELLVRDGSE